MDFKQIQQLVQPTDTKILLLVMDGLGDLPKGSGCGTPLEEAATPNLNTLAANSICGLHQPVGPGITPGSGPAHLALFGYDPFHYQVGRGVLDIEPDVVVITGDHSTPAVLKSHSWHPVPVLLHSHHCRPDGVDRFGERACMSGGLGPRMAATDLIAAGTG